MAGTWTQTGTALALQLLLNAGVKVHLFTGPVAPTKGAGAGDFTEPLDRNYRPKNLATDSWLVQAGDISKASHGAVTFDFAANIPSSIRGYFLSCEGVVVSVEVFRDGGGELAPVQINQVGSQMSVAPVLTLKAA
jgi:hypothetical protein